MDNKKSSIILVLILAIVIIICIIGIEEIIAFGIAMFIPIAIVVGAIMYAQKNNKKLKIYKK